MAIDLRESSDKTIGFILGIVAIVIFLTAVPQLWTVFSTALVGIVNANIPLVSGLTQILGIIFGAIVLVGVIRYMVSQSIAVDRHRMRVRSGYYRRQPVTVTTAGRYKYRYTRGVRGYTSRTYVPETTRIRRFN